MNFITSIENNLGKKAKFKFLPMQKGDVKKTHSSVHKLFLKTGFKPKISVDQGIKEFVKWHNEFYS